MRVLVVDESASRAESLCTALREAGHDVTATRAAPLELLETIEELQPDLILIDTARLRPVIEEMQALKLKLAERRLVERAKGLLMKSRGLDEEAAYAALRRMAMDRSVRIGEVARRVLDAADLLGA